MRHEESSVIRHRTPLSRVVFPAPGKAHDQVDDGGSDAHSGYNAFV
jgi:hypothetical protein